MKYKIYTEEHGTAHILSEMAIVSKACRLSPSATGKLRLIAEEILELTVRLFENLRYEFYIENEKQRFTLNLRTKTLVKSKRTDEETLSLSGNGGTYIKMGIFGKISGVFESLLMNGGEYEQLSVPYYNNMGITPYFSLAAYQRKIQKMERTEEWNCLEKSIIANIAKDVIIGVKNDSVVMITVIDF